ncbi:MAG: murC [Haloplasmataceae bacterium]|jgi:UDP-N-acetylmuramate--alanine ligase|nr:murC [Haloplasmataceae bacterium]
MAKFHFIGIKGAGMSSLACLLHDYGHEVRGSDVLDYFFTMKKLEKRNILMLPFSVSNIDKSYIIIVGNAFLDNEEHLLAKELGCEIYTYYEYLGILSKRFNSIGITGSHGKTTTTNLIRQILEYKDNINYLIGDGQGGGNSDTDLFVFEACEYRRHFLYYFPKMAVITNLDFDHPDYYKDIYDVRDAFVDYINQSEIIVYNGDDELLKTIIPKNKKTISFGLNPKNEFYAENISNDANYTSFDLYYNSKYKTNIKIPTFGIHSVYNALAAISATWQFIGNIEIIKDRLFKYIKSERRFQEKLLSNNQIIINDYAHHPKEIKATIEAAMCKYPFKKIIVYFQPHTYTRTITFLKEFGESLSQANKVYLREIFSSAREHNQIISINDLGKIIDKSQVINDNSYVDEFQKYKEAVIIFMGAGDIDRNYDYYLDAIENKK